MNWVQEREVNVAISNELLQGIEIQQEMALWFPPFFLSILLFFFSQALRSNNCHFSL